MLDKKEVKLLSTSAPENVISLKNKMNKCATPYSITNRVINKESDLLYPKSFFRIETVEDMDDMFDATTSADKIIKMM